MKVQPEPDIKNTGELFEALKARVEAARLPAGLSVTALVNLTGPDPAQWRISAAEGRLTLAEGAPADGQDLTLTLAAETAAGLHLKTINPLAAFMTGKIKVKGDPSKISQIKQILSGWLNKR